jgi:hypothetical protein
MPFKPLKVTDLGIVYNGSRQELKNRPGFSYEKKQWRVGYSIEGYILRSLLPIRK